MKDLSKVEGFETITERELEEVNGGGAFDFIGDIYDSWCDMWHEFGKSLHDLFHGK